MKKTISALIVAASITSAYAADVGFSVGRDRTSDKEYGAVSIGTSINTFRLEAEVGRVVDTGTSIGASIGKEFKVGPITVTPHVGAAYIEATEKTVKSGSVVTSGLGASYPITKQVSFTVDFSRMWDIQDRTNFQGNLVTAGLRTSF